MANSKSQLTYNDYVKGIKELKPEEQLRLIEIISAGLKKTVSGKKGKYKITDLEGLGAEIWHGIDAQDYVHKERSSWD